MNCPNCGQPIAPDEVFCGHCGTQLAPPEPIAPPASPTVPVTPVATKPARSLPVVPIVVGVAVVLLICCVCLGVVGLVGGLCAMPLPDTEPTPVATERPIAQPTLGAEATAVRPATAGPTIVMPTAELPFPGDTPLRITSYAQNTSSLSNSAVEIMGDVENTSNKAVDTGFYLVYVTLKDQNGQVIKTSKDLTTRLQRPILQPGQKSCFRSFFKAEDFGFALADVARLEAVVREDPAGHEAYTIELTTSNVKRTGNAVTGDVTNDTQYATRSVFILVTLYDSAGQVIGVHYGTRVGDEQLAPGGTMKFTYNIISSDAASTKSFDVLVIAYKQT
ncbi:MAG: zinc ribbon domain-containing protein [Chloroflexi bacterium]|nr:zinc ribbon domain-containing protein [Chloroflexota bacterium]MBU1750331.1 zinc ribbon domain-containing protein [Chloroflexota bacterium]MBU1877968.1 zinc ribbon domain-containing protein [Chloroflexota bacterium]